MTDADFDPIDTPLTPKVPLEQESLPGLGDDEDLVTGMGGGDDPIIDGVEVETDLEEHPAEADGRSRV